jgi:hypothetical protein
MPTVIHKCSGVPKLAVCFQQRYPPYPTLSLVQGFRLQHKVRLYLRTRHIMVSSNVNHRSMMADATLMPSSYTSARCDTCEDAPSSYLGCCFVDEVNGLVRQLPVRQVGVRQGGCRGQGCIGDAHTMVVLVPACTQQKHHEHDTCGYLSAVVRVQIQGYECQNASSQCQEGIRMTTCCMATCVRETSRMGLYNVAELHVVLIACGAEAPTCA